MKQVTNGHHQSGMTLVEIMISLAISSMLMAGMLSVYATTKQSDQARGGISKLQETGRFALNRLHSGVMSAGFPYYEAIDPIIYAVEQLPEKSEIQISEDGVGGDILTIAFQPQGNVYTTDCLGNEATENDLIINSYFIDDNRLMCRGNRGDTAAALTESIENMQVVYGIDSDSDATADQFLTATQINNSVAFSWSSVVSIQVALLVNSGQIYKQDSTRRTYHLFEETVTTNDQRLRSVFSKTIHLRNRTALSVE